MHSLDFIYKRHSVRKFKDQPVPNDDIKTIIKAATHAPSGKNLQNWHFVVIKDKEKIERIAQIIEEKNAALASEVKDDEMKNGFTKFLKYATIFRNAPVIILVYAGPYPETGLNVLKNIGASTEVIHNLLKTASGIQNIGAAIENLMLAAASMGYGTCWMSSMNYAAKEIDSYVGFEKEGYFLTTITPLGFPDGEIKSPPRKPVEEVMTIIE